MLPGPRNGCEWFLCAVIGFLGAVDVSNMCCSSSDMCSALRESVRNRMSSIPILCDDGWRFRHLSMSALRIPRHLIVNRFRLYLGLTSERFPSVWIKRVLGWFFRDAVQRPWELGPGTKIVYMKVQTQYERLALCDAMNVILWHGAYFARRRLQEPTVWWNSWWQRNNPIFDGRCRDGFHLYFSNKWLSCDQILQSVVSLILDLHPRELFSLEIWETGCEDDVELDPDRKFICAITSYGDRDDVSKSPRRSVVINGSQELFDLLCEEARARDGMAYQVSYLSALGLASPIVGISIRAACYGIHDEEEEAPVSAEYIFKNENGR